MGILQPKNQGRRELGRADLARRGGVVALVVVLLLFAAYLKTTGAFGGDPRVSAELANAGGSLRTGSDVKVRGVIVGRVTEIDRGAEGGVRVGMAVREDELHLVPENVVARILPATVFGTSFVDLVVHERASATTLRAGAVIPADRTQDTLELQQALDDIDRLVKALGPAELASAIGSAALALDGRGEQLGRTIDRVNDYLGLLNPRLPLVRGNTRRLAENLELVQEVAPDLLQATEDGLVTLRTVATQEAAITALIGGGTSLVRTANGFLGENQDDLVRYINGAALLLDAVYDNRRAGITGAIDANILLGQKIPTLLEHGYARTDATLVGDAPPYYGAGDRPAYRSSGTLGRASFRSLVGGGAP